MFSINRAPFVILISFAVLIFGCDSSGSSKKNSKYRYAVTEKSYDPDTDNISSVVKNEFGPEAKLADWNTIKSKYSDSKSNLVSFLDNIGIKEGDKAYVEKGGEQYWSEDRHYFIKRHNGNPGDNFLVHDDLHSNTLSLGSWHNPIPILVRLPK